MRDATRERLAYAAATAAIIGAGLLCRAPALGLPWPAAKYGGSILWGAMVYAALRAFNPRGAPVAHAGAAAIIAVGVELFRLYRRPGLDHFRATLAGKLLLGSVFSPWNALAYLIGIAGAASADAWIHSGRDRRRVS